MFTIESVHILLLSSLPEISIEAAAEAYHEQRAQYIPDAPALTDTLLEVGCEGDSLDLCLRRSRREAADAYHQQDDEYEQPALKDKPVGLPEPSGGIPESTLHRILTGIRDDVGNQTHHTNDETADKSPFTSLWSDFL